MVPKIFITGSSGYVGGSTTKALLAAHPEYEVTALVRDQAQEKIIKGAWPNVKTVIGTLDDEATLADEASKADVVLSMLFHDISDATIYSIKLP